MHSNTSTTDVTPQVAAERLLVWREVAAWTDYCAAEFVSDAATASYLEHVAQCQREEGERRYAERAGFTPAMSQV
jgi:hypothetical protein